MLIAWPQVNRGIPLLFRMTWTSRRCTMSRRIFFQLTNLAWSTEEEENNSEAQRRIAQLKDCHECRQCLSMCMFEAEVFFPLGTGWQFNRIFRPPNRPSKDGRRPKNERLWVGVELGHDLGHDLGGQKILLNCHPGPFLSSFLPFLSLPVTN